MTVVGSSLSALTTVTVGETISVVARFGLPEPPGRNSVTVPLTSTPSPTATPGKLVEDEDPVGRRRVRIGRRIGHPEAVARRGRDDALHAESIGADHEDGATPWISQISVGVTTTVRLIDAVALRSSASSILAVMTLSPATTSPTVAVNVKTRSPASSSLPTPSSANAWAASPSIGPRLADGHTAARRVLAGRDVDRQDRLLADADVVHSRTDAGRVRLDGNVAHRVPLPRKLDVSWGWKSHSTEGTKASEPIASPAWTVGFRVSVVLGGVRNRPHPGGSPGIEAYLAEDIDHRPVVLQDDRVVAVEVDDGGRQQIRLCLDLSLDSVWAMTYTAPSATLPDGASVCVTADEPFEYSSSVYPLRLTVAPVPL